MQPYCPSRPAQAPSQRHTKKRNQHISASCVPKRGSKWGSRTISSKAHSYSRLHPAFYASLSLRWQWQPLSRVWTCQQSHHDPGRSLSECIDSSFFLCRFLGAPQTERPHVGCIRIRTAVRIDGRNDSKASIGPVIFRRCLLHTYLPEFMDERCTQSRRRYGCRVLHDCERSEERRVGKEC